jgi:hypothetical protein
MKISKIISVTIFILFSIGCANENETGLNDEILTHKKNIPNIITNEIAARGDYERDSILNNIHTLSWAYYTGQYSRWYISTTVSNSTYFENIYSLTPIKNGKAGWATVGEGVISLDLSGHFFSVESNLDNDPSDRYFDIGWNEWVDGRDIHNDRQWIQGASDSLKWYFFQVEETGIWYIVNTPGYGSITSILKFSSTANGRYDWIETDTEDLTSVFTLNGDILSLSFVENACLSKSSMLVETVKDIPCIMRRKNWRFAADLMEYWFAGSGQNYNIDISDVTDISESATNAINNWENKALNNTLFDQGMWERLISELERTPNNSGGMVLPDGGTFNFIQTEIPPANQEWRPLASEQNTMHWFEEKVISDLSLDEYKAAFGEGVLRLVANGEVIVNNGNVTINVLEVGVYFRDSYDFIGNQFLGYWSYNSPYVGLLPGLSYFTLTNNNSFKTYNTSIGESEFHGNYRIFSSIKRIYTNESYNDY